MKHGHLSRYLRLVITGSEKALTEYLPTWQELATDQTTLCNAYGLTETTITCLVYTAPSLNNPQQTPFHTLPVGRPLTNIQAYVLNGMLRPVPVGAPGELFIGGACLARGYLHNPVATAERFIPNPFSDQPGARLYRTGDKGRWLAHGVLEFLGRFDRQVKLRGYRIELGEIENALRGYPGIHNAAVLLREDRPGEQQLTAYLVPVEHRELSLPELRRHLQAWLPGYMQPSSYVVLNQLPLTDRGKLDYHRLPSPQTREQGSTESYIAPQTEMQRTIASIWQQVLQRETIGIHDNFFDLGGHSLLLNRVYSSLSTIINKELSMLELIQHPTIFALANHLSQEQNTSPSFETSHVRASTRQELTRQQRQMRQQFRTTEKQKEMKHE